MSYRANTEQNSDDSNTVRRYRADSNNQRSYSSSAVKFPDY